MLDKMIEHFGNQAELAKALGCYPSNINVWYRNKQFPRKHLLEIERITKGKFKAISLLEYQESHKD